MTFRPNDRASLVAWLQEQPIPFAISKRETNGEPVLSLDQLDRVIDYQPDETNITVETGIRIQSLDALLASHGQWVPTLLDRQETTLLEALLYNRFHARSLTSAPLATSVLGGWFVTNRGVLFRSGSRVVKSVAGYDTHRAFVGSGGLLGLPVEVTLKVLPRPERFYRFYGRANDLEQLLPFNPTILQSVADQLVVELAGFREDVEHDVLQLLDANLVVQEIGGEWSNVLSSLAGPSVETSEADRLLLSLAASLNELSVRG